MRPLVMDAFNAGICVTFPSHRITLRLADKKKKNEYALPISVIRNHCGHFLIHVLFIIHFTN